MKKLIQILGAALLFSVISCVTTEPAAPKTSTAPSPQPTVAAPAPSATPAPWKTTVFVIGDSTASNYEASRFPRMGWGQVLNRFMKEDVRVINMAQSGSSSKSFILEGLFPRVRMQLREGDFLLIQFGHNDAKKGDPRYAEANTDYKKNLTTFVEEARKRGVHPIILTPIERRKFGANGTINPSHGDYPEAARQLAAELGVECIDMTTKSIALYEEAGDEGSKQLFLHLASGAHPNYPNGVADDTHLQENGAMKIAEIVCAGIKENASPLAAWLK